MIFMNPVRLMQRIGRIDRRMSPEVEALIKNNTLRKMNEARLRIGILAPDSLDNLINLYSKVTGKMILISKLLEFNTDMVLINSRNGHAS